MNVGQARRRARQAAVQAIYQWQVTQHNIGDIVKQFADEHVGTKTDMAYFEKLISGVAQNVSQIDELYKPYITRPFNELDPIERAILRLSVYELKYLLEVPYRVVINEAIDLGKRFGADKSHRFINGVVDKVANDTRQLEVSADKKRSS